ncbi:MAG: G5 domain-containing protein [Chloroflexota bacterium]|nr:G5 domain-containing protein [Chloroflexota bacterium]
MLRVASLSLVTLVVMAISWQAASLAAAQRGPADVSSRVEPVARGVPVSERVASSSETSRARQTAAGQMVVFSLGVPLTVVDGALTIPLRVPRAATVDEVLGLAGVALGPLDRISVAAREDAVVASGDVIQVVRVAETDTTVREVVPFTVTTVADPTLTVGRSVVTTPGVAGLAENTYRIRTANQVVESRALIATTALAAPVAEVRRVGTKPPPVPSDIETIIRTAAETWGADPTQLLRVSFCESRYNPNAYNASSGASGLFQFLATTWAPNSVRAGYAGTSVFDPVANANTAAYMFSIGQARQWQCK